MTVQHPRPALGLPLASWSSGARRHRGLARYEDGLIVLDPDKVETYIFDPVRQPGLLTEVAGIRAPADALGFAKRFGLIFAAPEIDPAVAAFVDSIDPRRRTHLVEPFARWEALAADLRAILRCFQILQHANRTDGPESAPGHVSDPAELRDLRRMLAQMYPRYNEVLDLGYGLGHMFTGQRVHRGPFDFSDDELLDAATVVMKDVVMWRRYESGADYALVAADDAGPEFLMMPVADTLEGFAWLEMIEVLTAGVDMATCPECALTFQVDDRRRRYCSSRCAGRARIRRFRAKNKEPLP